MNITFTLNYQSWSLADVPDEMLLIDLLRDVIGLTGTKRGCETGVCGACMVLVGDRAQRACRTPVAQLDGKTVTTIEGLSSPDGELSDLQEAFLDYGAVQCGFCTPGMVITAEALLRANPQPTRAEIRHALRRNLCRCTGYQQIVDAIAAVAQERAGATSLTLTGQSEHGEEEHG